MFNDLTPLLTPTRQVIVVDLKGTGGLQTSTGRSVSTAWRMMSPR
jgi:hypothetical protein